ncbi:MAG: hypothetical protein FWG15_05655 [Propionibacteriaceae bacterium]|nr:hypothetical protein [Propionibacteriaceae bacterium]
MILSSSQAGASGFVAPVYSIHLGESMKKIRTTLSAIAITGILFAVGACSSPESTPTDDFDDPIESTSPSYPTAPATDGDGRVLVYDDHGLWIYASTMLNWSGTIDADVCYYWVVTNNSDRDMYVSLHFNEVNGVSDRTLSGGNHIEPGATIKMEAHHSGSYYNIPVDCGGSCSADQSFGFTVVGDFEIYTGDDFVTGTEIAHGDFEIVVPQNWISGDDASAFRTDQPWVKAN